MDKRIRFGHWEFDTDSGELYGKDTVKRLEPTIARLLCYLLSNQGRVIRRDELIEHVWHNRIVSDDPINRSISVLRQVLTPDNKQAIIKTIPRKGYRAIFPEARAGNSGTAVDQPAPAFSASWIEHKVVWGVALVCALLVLLAVDWTHSETPAPPMPRLAVLPFNDLSQGANMAFLADGMSDTIIHLVSQVEGIAVTARTSSFRYKNVNASLTDIAAELDVDYVLEGSVQVFNNKMRVLARLIEVTSESELWSENFTRDFDDIFSVQDDIARGVIISLNGIVFEQAPSYEPAYETYQLVLQGMDAANKMTTQGDAQAITFFTQAIEQDPQYPLPYTLLARVLKQQVDTNPYLQLYPTTRQLEKLERINALVNTSLDLDPFSSEAHTLRALMLYFEGQISEAGKALKRALELQPNNATALADYAYWLQRDGQPERALQTARKAHSLDPQSSPINQTLAQVLWLNGRAEEAISVIKKNITHNPRSANNYTLLYRWALQQGKPGQAMLYAMQEKVIDPEDANSHWGVCLMHYQLWQKAQGDTCARELLTRFPDYYEARAWLNYGHPEKVKTIIRERMQQFPHVGYHRLQLADVLTNDQRYEQVLALLKPEYPDLYASPPVVNDWSLWGLKHLAFAEIKLGNRAVAEPMLEAGLAHVEKSRKLQAGGFSTGIDDVYFLMMLGRHNEALERLSQAIDNHWSFYSMSLPYEPIFEPLRGTPEFTALVQQQSAFLASQMEWYQRRL